MYISVSESSLPPLLLYYGRGGEHSARVLFVLHRVEAVGVQWLRDALGLVGHTLGILLSPIQAKYSPRSFVSLARSLNLQLRVYSLGSSLI